MEPPVARAEFTFAARPERVWRALEPDGLCGWQCEEAAGELRPGHSLSLGWPSLGLTTAVEVMEAVPGERLVLAGTGEAAGELQTSTLEPDDRGTRLTVEHAGFGAGRRARDRAAGSAAGLHVALRLLDLYLGGREGQRLVARAALGTIAAPVESLWATALADGGALASWLGPIDGGLDTEGAKLRVALGSRSRDAYLLARAAPYELAFAVPALDAVLRLRLIALGGELSLACVQLLSWAGDDAIAPFSSALVDALDRLVTNRGGAGAS